MSPRFPLKCLLAAWAAGCVGLVLGIWIAPEYFSRMGSVVVLFALMGEYALLKRELGLLYQRLTKGNGDGPGDLSPSRWHQKKALVSHATIVIGTFIWGFGDLLL